MTSSKIKYFATNDDSVTFISPYFVIKTLILFKQLYFLLTFPFAINACPNWQAEVENNNLEGWDYQLNPQNIAVVSDPQNPESEVIKLTITADSTWPNGHTRTEVKHNGCATEEGESTFFSWEFYLDKPVTTFNNIAYWETDKTYVQSMGLSLQPTTDGEKNSSTLAFFSNLPNRKVHWQNTINIAQWNRIALKITWSESEKLGQISVWFNQQPILTNLAVKTKPDANQLFVQLGLHRNQTESTIDNIYLRNVKEVASLTALLEIEE